jgi:hypothetical protein
MIKRNLRIIGLRSVSIMVVLFLTTCSNDSGPSGPDVDECEGEDVFGPAGGMIEITDTNSVFYGLRIVIPAGALKECRSFYIDEGFASGFPNGCVAYPTSNAQFDLSTGGEKPYDLTLEFYFPMKGMEIGSGEAPCAFGYDERVGKWNIIIPDSFDGTTMMVKTTYRDKWTWGKMDLDVISTENMIDAVIEKLGEEAWNTAIGGIAKAIDVMKTLYVDRTCQTWTRMRDTDLPNLIQIQKNSLLTYQSQISACGTCDLFSEKFGLQLSKYIMAKIQILTADLWNLFAGSWAGYLPFLSDLDMLISMQRYMALSFIWSQKCNYACVTQKLGLVVYETYAMYYVYSATQLMVTLAIEGGFWVSCP